MIALVACPNCNRSVDTQARYCEFCGVDLAVAAALEENRVQNSLQIPRGVVIAPEILVPRLGDYLLEKGIIGQNDLNQALHVQGHKTEAGEPALLGRVLVELGLVEPEIIDQVITEQILQLQSALRQYNTQLEQRVQERTQDLQKALEKLAELNQLKANFIANISHELRTPLTHMKGYLEILADGGLGSLNKEQQDAVSVIRKANKRLEQLIEDLIQFSLASRGELSLNIETANFNNLVALALTGAAQKAQTKGIILEENLSPNNPHVNCDGEKILWVISQLLDNAIKFTGKGGKVDVSTNCSVELATVVVNDTGIGIPPERIDEIFLPFHQLDGSPSRRYGGTGVGLALCSRIVEAHGSSIQVKSMVGKGSAFNFALPVARHP
jgi:signal transduction histidine kinase